MMKKLVALSLVAMLTSNVFAADVEQENVKKAAAEVAEKTVALKAAGLSNAEVMAVMEQEISNMTGDAQPAVAVKSKTKKYVLIGAVVAALTVVCGVAYKKGWYPAFLKKAATATTPATTTVAPTVTSAPTATVVAPTVATPATTTVTAPVVTAPVIATTPAPTAATTTTAAPAPTATVAAPKA